MTIEQWGSIGELLGSLGVLVTLVFLVVQIRQNTLTMRSTSLQTVLDGYTAANREYFATSPTSPTNRMVWSKGHEDFDTLTIDEQHLFHYFMTDYVFHLQNVLQLRDSGVLDEASFEAWNTHVVGAVGTPGALKWWDSVRDYFTTTVRDHLDRELRELGRTLPERDLRDPHAWIRSTSFFRDGHRPEPR